MCSKSYSNTLGHIGVVNEKLTGVYNNISTIAIEFADMVNPNSGYGVFYYNEEWVELLQEGVMIDKDLLDNILGGAE